MITLIACFDKVGGIGRNGSIPWHLPADLRHFKNVTQGQVVIMGRKTWESLPVRPLPGRHNVVVSREGYSLDQALATYPDAFVIGGAEIYGQAMPRAGRMVLTAIDHDYSCDRFFPRISPAEWGLMHAPEHHATQGGLNYSFTTWRRRATAI